jgi:membrane associated rhomboid family serine protease
MASEAPTCYRHADRRAGVKCQRCERWICPDCMHQASVGFHCPECLRTGGQQVYRGAQLHAALSRPVVTYALIAANALVFFVDLATAGSSGFGGGLVSMNETGGLVEQGALLGVGLTPAQEVIGVAQGEWWRIFTSGFLHAGFIHIGMNMLFLYLLGPLLERELGRIDFAALYVTSLVTGSFGVMLLDPFARTVGASGAIYGLLGAAVALQLSRGINPWSSGIGGLILINVLITFTVPGISIGGHLGGLIGGFAAGWMLVQISARLPRRQATIAGPLVCVAIIAVCVYGSIWAADHALATGQAVINL